MQCTKAGACCDLVSLLKNNDLLWRQMHQPYPDFLSSARITSSCVLVTLDHAWTAFQPASNLLIRSFRISAMLVDYVRL